MIKKEMIKTIGKVGIGVLSIGFFTSVGFACGKAETINILDKDRDTIDVDSLLKTLDEFINVADKLSCFEIFQLSCMKGYLMYRNL